MPAVVRAKASQRSQLDPRPEYQRVILSWPKGAAVAEATATGSQISSRLLSCSAANGLLVLPPLTKDATHVEVGQELDALVIGRLRM
jgi:molybdopterin biosynthesis enzyme